MKNLSHARKMDLKLLENDLITLSRLVGSNNCFYNITANAFHLGHCVSAYLNDPEQQAAKTSLFEVLTLTDDQSIKFI